MKLLTVIPAKGTSARIDPSKNLAPLGGKPLVAWTIEAAVRLASPEHRVIVSTDDDRIANEARLRRAEVIRRPPELCRDPAQISAGALHALDVLADWTPDAVMILLPTSPFRTTHQITDALALFDGTRNVVACTDATDCLHHKFCVQQEGKILAGPPLRCGDEYFDWFLPPQGRAVLLTGALWISSVERFRKDGHVSAVGAVPYIMDDESGLDIDAPNDLLLARAIVARGRAT